ncbi:MAG: hypothetical protein LQ344_006869 [Seirophora lacunosa]|nr:MAG: hypothetical protein LQ344_006869 [Seirophora lacunosa]
MEANLRGRMTDALRLSSLPRESRIELALHDLAKFFADSGINVYDEFIEYFDVCWSNEQANVFVSTWIAGALDSSLTTVRDVLDRPDVIALKGEAPVSHSVSIEPLPESIAFRIPDNLNVEYVSMPRTDQSTVHSSMFLLYFRYGAARSNLDFESC